MSREIKFRAFYKGKMTENVPVYQNKWYAIDSVTPIEMAFIPCVLMQFTGLKDKNGKDVYEGDVIRFIGYRGESGCKDCGTYKSGDENHFIHWDNCGWSHNTGLDSFTLEYTDLSSVEVIGNMHENPELI